MKTFPLYISDKLRTVLSEIDHDIARDLLNNHCDIEFQVQYSFLDIDPTKSTLITCIRPNKAIEFLNVEKGDADTVVDNKLANFLSTVTDSNDVYKKNRNSIKLGRIINLLFPGKYPLSSSGGQNTQDIESFVNLYKALYNRGDKFSAMELLTGDNIGKFYKYTKYSHNTGTLGSSCMKNMSARTFRIYGRYEETVSMLVLYSDKAHTKISARAIVWKLSEPVDKYFMDRVYSNNSSDEQIFIDYAQQNSWLYKSRQSMGSGVGISDGNIGNSSNVKLTVQFPERTEFNQYPYMDTMSYYTPRTGVLSNKNNNGHYRLTSTGGGYETLSTYIPNPTKVFSKFHNREIFEHDGVYCKFGDDWVLTESAHKVTNGGADGPHYAIPDHPNVVNSSFEVNGRERQRTYNRYFLKDKCVWSEYLETWLFYSAGTTNGATEIWLELDRSVSGLDHKKRLGIEFFEVDGEFWHKSLVTKTKTKRLRRNRRDEE